MNSDPSASQHVRSTFDTVQEVVEYEKIWQDIFESALNTKVCLISTVLFLKNRNVSYLSLNNTQKTLYLKKLCKIIGFCFIFFT